MDNIEIAKKAYADFSRGDVAAILEGLDENVEWITPGQGLPTCGVRHGKAEVAEFFRLVAATWKFHAFEPREFISSGDALAVRGHYDATAIATGRRAAGDWVMTWRIRNGKVTQFQEYTDTAALLDAMTARSAA